MKSDIKAYKVLVDSKVARATLICVTYRISLSTPHYGAEFYQLVTSFDNSVFNIPLGSHTFSFQEELRLFSTAAGIAPDNRQNIEDWIKTKMIEAYGEGNKISVENFPAD